MSGTGGTTAETPVRKLARARRILIVDPGGAGKSTLALRLGEILNLEVIHLDRFYWRTGWTQPAPDEWKTMVRWLVARESWIIDGNYGGTLDLRLAAADAVIFLDFPRPLCIRRVLARRLRYARRSRPDMTPGCPERVTFEFLKYIWRYPSEHRPSILCKLESLSPGTPALVLRSPGETRRFLADIENLTAPVGKR